MLLDFLRTRLITVDELHRRLASGERFLVIDVREPMELADGRIPGAVNVPLKEFRSRGAEIATGSDLPLILVCKSGIRSLVALWAAKKPGARSLRGGMDAWMARGFEVIRDGTRQPAAPARKAC